MFHLEIKPTIECDFQSGSGHSQVKHYHANIMTKAICVQTCLDMQKSTHPAVNGVSMDIMRADCYCHEGMVGRDEKKIHESSCFLPTSGMFLETISKIWEIISFHL